MRPVEALVGRLRKRAKKLSLVSSELEYGIRYI